MIRNVVNDRAEKSARGATIVNIPAPESFNTKQPLFQQLQNDINSVFFNCGVGDHSTIQ